MSAKSVYLFANTHGPLADNIVLLDKIVSAYDMAEYGAFSWPELLTFSGHRYAWRDGFALTVYTALSVAELAEALKSPLSQLKRWTLFCSENEYLEFPPYGPLSESMFALRGRQIMLYFLLAKETDYSFAGAVSEVVGQMKSSIAYAICEFHDGLILAVSTNDPLKIAVQRSYKALSRFEDWVFISVDDVKALGDRQPWVRVGSLEFDNLLRRMIHDAGAGP